MQRQTWRGRSLGTPSHREPQAINVSIGSKRSLPTFVSGIAVEAAPDRLAGDEARIRQESQPIGEDVRRHAEFP